MGHGLGTVGVDGLRRMLVFFGEIDLGEGRSVDDTIRLSAQNGLCAVLWVEQVGILPAEGRYTGVGTQFAQPDRSVQKPGFSC